MSIDITASVLARRNLSKNTKSFAKKLLPILITIPVLFGLFKLSTALGAQPPPTVTASVDVYSQCSNDLGSGYTSGDLGCEWTNGNLQHNNSTYHEGDATPQRLALKDLTNGSHTITFSYDTTKGGKHAYDFITDDKYSENWITDADMCDAPISNFAHCSTATATQSGLIPTDTHAAGHDTAVTARHFTIRNGTITNVGTPTLASGTYGGDSETTIQVTFLVNTSSCLDKYQVQGIDVCEVLITFGAHISTQADWGVGNSAVNITGSPYHVALVELDNGTIGQRDNQMQAGAIAQTPVITTELHNDADNSVIALGSTVQAGTSVHDKATVAKTGNSNSFPTGTVTFRFYSSDTTCASDTGFTGGVTKGTITLASGVADPSTATGALGPGTYSFKAKYNSSDISTWTDAVSTCETFTVNQGTSAVATTLKDASNNTVTEGSSAALGAIMHDSATVTLTPSAAPDGSVTFRFYNTSADCTADTNFTGGTTMGTVALTGTPGVANPSTATSALGAGTYAFKANWPGNTNYAGNTSSCETFTVNKAQLSVTTAAHDAAHTDITNSNVALGTVMHDTATVTGGVAGFSLPAVSFTLTTGYTESCAGGSAVANNGTEGGAVKSADSSALGAGTYAYRAVVAGDDNYVGNTSSCEPFTVSPATLGLSTTVHNNSGDIALVGSLPLGGGAHDSASVTGQVSGFSLPDVTFYFFASGAACTNGSTTNGTVLNTVSPDGNGVAHPSTSETHLAAGTYNFMAVVASNSNYTGKTGNCEPFTVDKATPGITTEIHLVGDKLESVVAGPVALGSTVHDKATVTGIGSEGLNPSGNVEFTFYTGDCNQTLNSSSAGAVALDGNDPGVAHPSNNETNLSAGNYHFVAHYVGDSNYNAATSDCEPLTVNQARLGISTVIHDANHTPITTAGLGAVVHDTASVSGQVGSITPTGTVTFVFFNNKACSDTGTTVSTTSDGTDSVRAPDTSALGAGDYSYQASVAGDANYIGDTATCEPLTVGKAQLGIVTTVHDTSHNPITPAQPLGTTVHDSAAVTGAVSGFSLPNVSFTFFSNGSCDPANNAGSSAGSAAVVSGLADPSSSEGPLGAGSYSFSATIPDSADYTGATAVCEPLTINKAQLGISTKVHDAGHTDITNTSVGLGTVTHDTAAVTGAVAGFSVPAVSFSFTTGYTDSCASGTAVANSGNEIGGDYASVDSSALGAGTYAYRAAIGDNDNYTGTTGTCEPFTVNKGTPTVVTEIHNASEAVVTSVDAGTTVHDKATVTGGIAVALTGNVNFQFFNNDSCAGEDNPAGTNVSLVSGVAHPSQSEGPLNAGSYSFLAHYNGDANYAAADAACEPLSVNQLTPNIGTTASAGGVVGVKIHDSASVTGGYNPSGTVTFYLFGPGDTCSNNATALATETDPLTSGTAGPTADYTTLAVGTYHWKAIYSGDTNNASVTSLCSSEAVTITKASPSISTVPSAGGNVGIVLNDTATVTGGNNPTGSVTFKLYGPAAPSCTGTPAYTFTDTSSPYATAPGFTTNAAGTWRWTATYNGDANNNTATSGCNDEQVTITQPVLLWCSPGFWAQALAKNRTGVLTYLFTHTTPGLDLTKVHYLDIPSNLRAPLSKKAPKTNPTLAEVLASPSSYGGPAFNSVADYIAFRLGWNGTQATGENCPLDAHGNLTTTLTH